MLPTGHNNLSLYINIFVLTFCLLQAAILVGKDDDELELKDDDLHLECSPKNILVKVSVINVM